MHTPYVCENVGVCACACCAHVCVLHNIFDAHAQCAAAAEEELKILRNGTQFNYLNLSLNWQWFSDIWCIELMAALEKVS